MYLLKDEIKGVYTQIGLHDVITIMVQTDGIRISSSDPNIPLDQSNLVWKAAMLMQEVSGIRTGIQVHIDKRIPIAAGLAGGSADAACALNGLNSIWGLSLSKTELVRLAEQIGYDVCYCVLGGNAIVAGKGEIISPFYTSLKIPIVIANPGYAILTSDAYKWPNLVNHQLKQQEREIIDAFISGNKRVVASNLYNRFGDHALSIYPEISIIKETFSAYGALGSSLSGSGASVFAIAKSREHAREIAQIIRSKGWYAWYGWTL